MLMVVVDWNYLTSNMSHELKTQFIQNVRALRRWREIARTMIFFLYVFKMH